MTSVSGQRFFRQLHVQKDDIRLFGGEGPLQGRAAIGLGHDVFPFQPKPQHLAKVGEVVND